MLGFRIWVQGLGFRDYWGSNIEARMVTNLIPLGFLMVPPHSKIRRHMCNSGSIGL